MNSTGETEKERADREREREGRRKKWKEREGKRRELSKQAKKKKKNLFVIKINGVKPLLGRWSSCVSFLFLLLSKTTTNYAPTPLRITYKNKPKST